jgi:hypothetical protein
VITIKSVTVKAYKCGDVLINGGVDEGANVFCVQSIRKQRVSAMLEFRVCNKMPFEAN